jgi:hypothetical protein
MNINDQHTGQEPFNVGGMTSKNTNRSAPAGMIADDPAIGNNQCISPGDTFSPPSKRQQSSIHGVVLLFSIVCTYCVLWQLCQIYIPWCHAGFKLSICILWISLVYILGYQRDDPRSERSTMQNFTPSYITYFSGFLPVIFLLVLAVSPRHASTTKPPLNLLIPSYLTIIILVWLYFRLLVISVFETCYSLDHVKSNIYREQLITGMITCTFDVDIKGAMRFINRNKMKHDTSDSPNNTSFDVSVNEAGDVSFMNNNVAVTVTHIAIKAVAKALSENPVLNKRRIRIPYLAIDGTYQTKGIAVVTPGPSTTGTSYNADSYVVLLNADNLTVEEISYESSTQANRIQEEYRSVRFMLLPWWTHLLIRKLGILQYVLRPHHQPTLHDCTAMVITSPNSSKLAHVNINVAPPLIDTAKSPPIVVAIGGVHVVKKNDKSQFLMSVSVSMDCQYANVATCRRFCEQVQNLLQIPEPCDS